MYTDSTDRSNDTFAIAVQKTQSSHSSDIFDLSKNICRCPYLISYPPQKFSPFIQLQQLLLIFIILHE